MGSEAAAAEQFGPYLVYERLGIGGMATVHRAIERAGVEEFERVVALKRLLPHLAEDATFIKAFVREAKLAALLTHVNIGQIYDLGRVGTQYFISMEYIDGCDLRRILRHARSINTPPPIHVTVAVMLQLCDALDYAHNKTDDDGTPLGLVHRDVSPSNLLLTTSGHLKVIDFGIAKAQSLQLRTQTGRAKGKLAYMAPEAVLASRELDARSDLWAVGVILHELLTARPLFWSKNEYQTLIKIEQGDITPPSSLNPNAPPGLDAIVAKALSRDVNDRFMTAAEIRSELMRVRRENQLATTERDIAQWLGPALGAVMLHKAISSQQLPAAPAATAVSPDAVPTLKVATAIEPAPPPTEAESSESDAMEPDWGIELADRGLALDDVPDVAVEGSTSPPPGTLDAPAAPSPRASSPPPARGDDSDLPAGYRQAVRFSTPYLGPPAAARSEQPSQSQTAVAVERPPFPGVRRRRRARQWGLGLGLAAIASAAAVVTLYATTSSPPTESERSPTHGTIEIATEPGDATIRINELTHIGSPWSAKLPAGTHNVVVERLKYDSWHATVDLSLGETQRFRLTLQPEGTRARNLHDPDSPNATLALATTPAGIEVILDGQVLHQRTPITIAIKPGDHAVVLRQGGIERWWQGFTALPGSSYEFSPRFSEESVMPQNR